MNCTSASAGTGAALVSPETAAVRTARQHVNHRPSRAA